MVLSAGVISVPSEGTVSGMVRVEPIAALGGALKYRPVPRRPHRPRTLRQGGDTLARVVRVGEVGGAGG
jgi:hypothetical protein